MRISKFFVKTLKEIPSEAETPSHILMYRAGMIQKLSSGIYNYLPLALRSIRKIENIIREELDKRDCQEVLMPMVQPADLWKESGRWGFYGPELLRFQDRKKNDYCLGPTHEEVITDMVRKNLKSYKQLPWNLYQIQGKFRDEVRPRFGLMRGREFIMKDAYSFDATVEGAKESYRLMYEAYTAIFNRCGLKFRAVDAATGNIGGDMSHEFQVLAETGEDLILSCNACDYAANNEKAVKVCATASVSGSATAAPYSKINTPGKGSIEDVSSLLGLDPKLFIKAILYRVDEKDFVMVLLRGDMEVNEAKVQAYLKASLLEMAFEADVKRITQAGIGFAGPVGMKGKIRIIADNHVMTGTGMICGANETDYHLKDVVPGRDFEPDDVSDFSFAKGGDQCPVCKTGKLEEHRGIEVGQVFYLGTKYSLPMKCSFLDENGKEQPAVMGCYGIGVSRTMASAIEQNHDDKGIIWPRAIAPFEIAVIPLQGNKPEVVETAQRIYNELKAQGVDVCLDDRNEGAGFKLNDAELIGYPVQILIGSRTLEQGQVELLARRTMEKTLSTVAEATAQAMALLNRV